MSLDTYEILKKLKEGELSIEETEGMLRRQRFEEMGYAKMDSDRKLRDGCQEGIFWSGKSE